MFGILKSCRTNTNKLSAPGSIDRRVARTRAALHEALLILMAKKSYDAITVEDICRRAGVGRSTFYAHYTGKDDLKRSGLEQMRQMLLTRQRKRTATNSVHDFKFSLPMFEHARDHLHQYRALAGSRSGTMALNTIRRVLNEFVRNEITTGGHALHDQPPELVVEYFVGAYMALLTWWLDRGAKLMPEQMNAIFQELSNARLMSRMCPETGGAAAQLARSRQK